MFSKNLRFYRLRKSMTKRELATECGLSPMAITNYENGDRFPDMDILKKLAQALDVTVSDFLDARNSNLSFQHGEFRKSSALTKTTQEYIRESVEEYFSRFYTVVELLGGKVLPDAPEYGALELCEDTEQSAELMRKHLGFPTDGSIPNLTAWLEDKGILLYFCDIQDKKFSGMNGLVNNRPYIVVNSTMSAERIRSTIAHELAHIFFKWSDDMPYYTVEQTATAISGAFVFPKEDAIRELGIHRTAVTNDMTLVCKEYGISMFLLVKRAEQLNIISESVAHDFYVKASVTGWRTNEPSRIAPEYPLLFNQLVYRAVSEEEISIQKGAELLRVPYTDVAKQCNYAGG